MCNMQKWRKARGLTQAQLAEKAMVSYWWVIKVERGVLRIDDARYTTILCVANALGVQFYDLFDNRAMREETIRNLRMGRLVT